MKFEEKNLTGIPHEGGEISFHYPAFKGTYASVAEQIDKEKLKRPSSAETASLVYEAWENQKGEKESEIISILKNNWLWEFTGNLYLPKSNEEVNNGVILDLDSQNLKFENGPKGISSGVKLVMDKNSLVQRLKNNDNSVKFVPFGYKTGNQTWKELETNDYIKARYSEEGAQKISEIASKYKNKPFLHGFESIHEDKIKLSVLAEGWHFSKGLVIYSNWEDGGSGRVVALNG